MKAISLNQIITFLRGKLADLQAVYVYGSYVTGGFSAESDLDLAVRVAGELENPTRWKVQEELASLISRDIDLLDLGQASLVMQFQVISTGERIYCVDQDIAAQHEMLVYSRYLDFSLTRKPIIEAVQERGSVYGSG